MLYPYKVLPNSFIKVEEGVVAGTPFNLPRDYALPGGSVASNVESLNATEKRTIGLYPVTETIPAFDKRCQYLEPVVTLGEVSVTITYTVHDVLLSTLKTQAIGKAYAKCKTLLNSQSEVYPDAEIATFPFIRLEILTFNTNGQAGPFMTDVVARGRHTGQSLSDLLTPKIALEDAQYQIRDNHVSAITALTTVVDVADYIDLHFPD
jgi:hypothetical protein